MADEFIDNIVEPTDKAARTYTGLTPESAAESIIKNLTNTSGKPDFIQYAVDTVMAYLNNYHQPDREERLNAIKAEIEKKQKENLPRELKIAFELIN